jgi:hypothetical protein
MTDVGIGWLGEFDLPPPPLLCGTPHGSIWYEISHKGGVMLTWISRPVVVSHLHAPASNKGKQPGKSAEQSSCSLPTAEAVVVGWWETVSEIGALLDKGGWEQNS